ncbi:MAG: ATP-dependent DNA helicase RecQ [Gemmatimonadaceae bacterium]|nr:ATP-dependent DNA helicase RecQ [Gemmatimonadaceae bacterium]
MERPTIESARAALRASFGYGEFRPGQEQAIESVLSGRDTLVVLPTGGGKSVCYQIPALVLPGITVVVSPLISLMKDQVDALEARGLPAAFVNSTLTSGQVSDRLARAARGEIKLLYLAPERFDFGNVAARLADMGVALLAIDEAHCISQWGHDFRPSYLRVAEARRKLGMPPTVALTATATPEVREDICRQLALQRPRTIITGFDRTNLTYHVLPARNEAEKDSLLVRTLRANEGLAVIYAATRKSVDRISLLLEREGIQAAAYHAGLDDSHRRDVQESFMTERIRAIVATNAFGMGIDKPNVRIVLHHSMPGTLEAYYQEAGRAGRDGKRSNVYLLHSFPDRFTHEFFIRGNYPERPFVEQVYAALCRVASGGRALPSSAEDVVPLLRGKAGPREVESALRILALGGAMAGAESSGSSVHVRLLATPQRIRREVTGEANQELGLLRALWRVAGESLNTGAVVNLDALPPGLAGRSQCTALLQSMQSRQLLVWERIDGGMRLSNATTPLTKFRIDWASLERRRSAELSKLAAVQRYAYTKGCRRGFVLRYFGDPAARNRCRGCDNCLGTAVEREAAGSQATKPKTRDRAARGGRDAWGLSPRPETVATEVAQVSFDPETTLDEASSRLFAELRTRRSDIAREERVPAYIVFSDRTLAEMAFQKPHSLDAMSRVRGVGAMKLNKYGEKFLAVILKNADH